ncbi:MAG: hypothetical protein QXP35_00215 [Candidatus Micrarchaeaceae archaeon]
MLVKDTTKNNKNSFIFLIIMAIIIVAAVYILFFSNNNKIKTLTSEYSFNLNSTPFLFNINNSEYSIYLFSTAKNKANVYIQRFPNFINPLLNISIYINNSTKVNIGSKYADLEIKLNSISSNYINVSLIPLQQYLLIKPESGSINIVNTYSKNYGLANTSKANTTATTTLSTTTTTTVSSTTPLPAPVNSTQNKSLAQQLLKNNKYYTLMENYSDFYQNAANNCTSLLYNSTYLSYYKQQASGPMAYKNIKNNSPSNISVNISNKNNLFYFEYSATSSNLSVAGKILTLIVNTSSNTVSNSTFSGIFKGSDYTSMLNNYLTAIKITNSCAAYVV